MVAIRHDRAARSRSLLCPLSYLVIWPMECADNEPVVRDKNVLTPNRQSALARGPCRGAHKAVVAKLRGAIRPCAISSKESSVAQCLDRKPSDGETADPRAIMNSGPSPRMQAPPATHPELVSSFRPNRRTGAEPSPKYHFLQIILEHAKNFRFWLTQQCAEFSFLLDQSLVEHHCRMAETRGFDGIMTDEDERDVLLLDEPTNIFQQCGLDQQIKIGKGFVETARNVVERPRRARAATRRCCPPEILLGMRAARCSILHSESASSARRRALHFRQPLGRETQKHVFQHGQTRPECEILEHHRHAA